MCRQLYTHTYNSIRGPAVCGYNILLYHTIAWSTNYIILYTKHVIQ